MKNGRSSITLYSICLVLALSLGALAISGCGAESEESAGIGASNNASNNGDSNFGNNGDNNAPNDSNGDWNNNNTGGNNGGNNGDNNASNNNSGFDQEPGGNTNVSLSGAQDFGYFRRLLDDNIVPSPGDMDPAGFFAEHHTVLPQPDCGERICLQGMLGVMNNLIDGNNCTMLQVGLNSPLTPDPDNRPGMNLAVVIDVSGSMNRSGKIDFVRSGLHKMINELQDGDQIALVTYDTRVETIFEMAPIRGNRNDLANIVDALQADGSTNLYDGLQRGYRQLEESYDSGRQNRLILLSDGEPTAGETDPAAILSMSRSYNSEGLGLTTVGLGSDFNVSLMRDMAQQADGNFYFVENAGAVDEVFTEELSYFTLPVAFDLTVTLNEGSDYQFARAMGSSFWEDTETGGRLEVPSVFLAHRTSDDDVTDDGGRRGGGSALLVELMPREDDGSQPGSAEVASLELSFREPGTNRIVTETLEVGYPYSPWEVLRSGFFENDIVIKSFVMLNIYVGLEQACGFFHEGDPVEGIVILDRLIAAAQDYNEEEEDVDIDFDIELMEQLIEVIINNSGADPEDTPIDEDPWPAD